MGPTQSRFPNTRSNLETSSRTVRIAIVPQTWTQPDSDTDATEESTQAATESTPPVTEGNHRTVEIETIGEQGDGIARVERGYVVIVPDTDPQTISLCSSISRCSHSISPLSDMHNERGHPCGTTSSQRLY
ncbi:TRAM domain-containing protein [Halalkalicoccus tibetensis]|uniref:TRAM domain-containing protein n=1 Tax=Halalkalicoccus tibetensis TaxID=175632 RepID=A0ABD5VCU1_9EURY